MSHNLPQYAHIHLITPPPPLFDVYFFKFFYFKVGVDGEFWQNFIWARVGMRLKRFVTLILIAWLFREDKKETLIYMLEKEIETRL